MKKQITVDDVKRMWMCAVGGWFLNKDYREQEWKQYKRLARQANKTLEQAYNELNELHWYNLHH